MTVSYSKETVDQILAVVSERPGVIHFHVARELGLKPRELDEWLRTVGVRFYDLLHHEERWWTRDSQWIEPASKNASLYRFALETHRDKFFDKKRVPKKEESEFQRRFKAEAERCLKERKED